MMYLYHALVTVCVHVLIVDRDDVHVPCVANQMQILFCCP